MYQLDKKRLFRLFIGLFRTDSSATANGPSTFSAKACNVFTGFLFRSSLINEILNQSSLEEVGFFMWMFVLIGVLFVVGVTILLVNDGSYHLSQVGGGGALFLILVVLILYCMSLMKKKK